MNTKKLFTIASYVIIQLLLLTNMGLAEIIVASNLRYSYLNTLSPALSIDMPTFKKTFAASRSNAPNLNANALAIKLKNLERLRGILEKGILSIFEQIQNGQKNLSSIDQHDGRDSVDFNARIHANFTHPGLIKEHDILIEGLFYNRFQGIIPVVMERFYDKKIGLIKHDNFSQQDFETILSERAQYSMVVLIDPKKISAPNKALLAELRSTWDVHAPFFPHEISFANAFSPESIMKMFIPEKFAESLGVKVLENKNVVIVPDELELEIEIYRPFEFSPAVTIPKGRKGTILIPDYAQAITPHLSTQEYLVHIVRFFSPSDVNFQNFNSTLKKTLKEKTAPQQQAAEHLNAITMLSKKLVQPMPLKSAIEYSI